MPRSRRIVAVAVLTCVFVVTGCSTDEGPGTASLSSAPPTSATAPVPATSTTTSAGNSVTGKGGTFAVTPPKGWSEASDQVGSAPGLETVLLSEERNGSFSDNLVVTSMPGDAETAKEELAKGRQTLEGEGGTVTQAPDKQVGDTVASGLATAFEQQGIKVLARSYALTHGGRVYLLTLSSSQEGADEAMARFDEILGTWRWL